MKQIKIRFAAAALLSLALSHATFAGTRTLIGSSGSSEVQLLELYSSEGCSSCPPADEWISKFTNDSDLWKHFVPVVFHVDYWNRLGWTDELSSSRMTERQHQYASLWGTDTVYTPGVVLNGKELKGWSQSTPGKEKATPAIVALSIYRETDGSFTVKVDQNKSAKHLVVKIAELGMGITSNVTRGENSGRILNHNFVVLSWDSKALAPGQTEEHFKLNASDKPNEKSSRHAIAAWIEEDGKQTPLQATGGYL